ncbi:MAG: helix-turn-helix transcriptional regulator [Clostridia bacterium]|nr:helix-turn-helix transcriptional regulator [Clostridia bacterium]
MMKSKHFGRILRNRREELGWSLQKVSELCNMSTKGYEKIELGDSNPRL